MNAPSTSARPAGALTAEAQRAAKEQRWSDAATAWEAVLAAGEGPRPTALTRLAHAHRRGGDLAAAEAVLAPAVREFPRHTGLATEHARVAVTSRDWAAAVTRWERVIELDSSEPERFAQLARAQARDAQLDAAAATLARAVELHPGDPTIATESARLAVVAKDWPEAVRRWERVCALGDRPPPAEAFSQLAKAHQAMGNVDDADAALERGLEHHPGDLELLERGAQLATDRRDWPEVIARWEQVLHDAGDGAPLRAYLDVAAAHRALGDLAAAEAALELGRARHPEDLDIATSWAKLATAARDHERAYARFSAVIELPGAPPRTHRDRARAAAAGDDWDAADDALTRGLVDHPESPLLLVERAFMEVRRGDWEAVDRRWADATTHGAPAYLYAGMARRCAAAFEHDRADRVIEQGIAEHPTDRPVRRQAVQNAISVQRREHAPQDWDWRQALERAHRALDSFGRDLDPDDHLGLATDLADASAIDEAREILRRGAEAFPTADELAWEIAVLAAASGDWHEAASRLEPLAARPDAPPDVRSATVRAYLGRGDLTLAARTVAAGDDRDVATWCERARVATAAGDHAAAVDAWRNAVALDPGARRLRRHLAVACRRAGDEDAARAVVAVAARDGRRIETNPGVIAIIAGGPSLTGVDLSVLRGRVHAVAVNATATVLPWCDVAVTHDASHLTERFHGFDHLVVAGLPREAARSRGTLPGFDVRRRLVTDRLSELDGVLHSGGHTSAHTALGYAYLLRPRRIVLFGVDLTEFWGPDDYWHTAMDEQNRRRFTELSGRAHFDRWSEFRNRKLAGAPAVFASTLPQLEAAGTEVINASPESSVTCFDRVTPEQGIARCLEDELAVEGT